MRPPDGDAKYDYGPEGPVPIYQHRAEFEQLLALYKERKPRRVLEIGSYHGGTLYHWIVNAVPGATVVSVDTYTAADNRHLYQTWAPGDIHLHVIQGDSRDPAIVAHVRKHGPFDFTFIDADHTLPAVTDDWNNYGPMTRGLVAFHDILEHPNHPEIQVKTLWDQIRQENQSAFDIVWDRDAWWGGIGVVLT